VECGLNCGKYQILWKVCQTRESIRFCGKCVLNWGKYLWKWVKLRKVSVESMLNWGKYLWKVG